MICRHRWKPQFPKVTGNRPGTVCGTILRGPPRFRWRRTVTGEAEGIHIAGRLDRSLDRGKRLVGQYTFPKFGTSGTSEYIPLHPSLKLRHWFWTRPQSREKTQSSAQDDEIY